MQSYFLRRKHRCSLLEQALPTFPQLPEDDYLCLFEGTAGSCSLKETNTKHVISSESQKHLHDFYQAPTYMLVSEELN